jgi:hypothetical protein
VTRVIDSTPLFEMLVEQGHSRRAVARALLKALPRIGRHWWTQGTGVN